MQTHTRAFNFYNAVLDTFGAKYPRLFEQGIGMVKVLHVFDNKLPMIEALLGRNLLTGLVLKKSSSETQREIADKISAIAEEREIKLQRSETTYARALPELSRVNADRPFILGDHGGYYAHLLNSIAQRFGDQFIGSTEHTLNGDIRRSGRLSAPFLSTARVDLKERSDRNIAKSIADEVRDMVIEASGVDIYSTNQDKRILMVGYGMMGMHAAQYMKASGCQAELIITDINPKKTAFAVQDGHAVETDFEAVLPTCDIVILATDTIICRRPVLTPEQFALLKHDVCITSMTSMDDEVRQFDRIADGTITRIGKEGSAGVYMGPAGNRLKFLLDGRPANVALTDGGSGVDIHMVEAAGLAGAFVVASEGRRLSRTLPDEDAEIIAGLWLKHFKDIDVAPRV